MVIYSNRLYLPTTASHGYKWVILAPRCIYAKQVFNNLLGACIIHRVMCHLFNISLKFNRVRTRIGFGGKLAHEAKAQCMLECELPT